MLNLEAASVRGPPPVDEIRLLMSCRSFHSKYPDAGTKQRRFLNAVRKDGFSATVSAPALISFWPIFSSFAPDGISPPLVIASGAISADHVLNVLARLRQTPTLTVDTTLRLQEEPLADPERYDQLRRMEVSHD